VADDLVPVPMTEETLAAKLAEAREAAGPDGRVEVRTAPSALWLTAAAILGGTDGVLMDASLPDGTWAVVPVPAPPVPAEEEP
jgi:hypothetical protein